jgi:nucleoside-diphosphate-sugar epimerase
MGRAAHLQCLRSPVYSDSLEVTPLSSNLVTGASGFLGSHLAEALVARGERVRALARPTSKLAFLQSLGVELAYGDLTDGQSLRTALEGIERVYHCAALVADWGARGTDQSFTIAKARRELGYEPAVDFDEGMRRVEVWLRECNTV